MSPPFFIYKSRNWIYGLDIEMKEKEKDLQTKYRTQGKYL